MRDGASYFAVDTPLNNMIEGLTAGLTGDSRFIQSSAKAQAALAKINSTYSHLVKVAAGYGARIPHSVIGQ